MNTTLPTLKRLDSQPTLHMQRLRSPAIAALLALTILLGKVVVCHDAPARGVFFDAVLLIPISILAYHEGFLTALIASFVIAAADLVLRTRGSGLTIPAYLASSGVPTAVTARVLTFELVAVIVAAFSRKARRETATADRRVRQYLQKIDLLEKHSEAMERDAQTKQAEFEQSLIKYSSLVYLLEESAQKIYSNLEIDRLFQSLFRVLEECFGAVSASIYLKDAYDGSYYLAGASGNEHIPADAIPMVMPRDGRVVIDLEKNRRAICWEDQYPNQDDRPTNALVSGVLMDKGNPIGIIHIHATDNSVPTDIRLMIMVCNIASIALANARLFTEVQWLADHDPLTRLHNRRSFHEQLELQISTRSGLAGSDRRFAVLMLDIDHFKSINDIFGHQAGDAVLTWFARHCQECSGPGNLLFRYGGEEFTVVMPGAGPDQALQTAERIRSRIENSMFQYDTHEVHITVSCGVAVYPDHGTGGDQLIRRSDKAMYKAKALGRNAIAIDDTAEPITVVASHLLPHPPAWADHDPVADSASKTADTN